MYAFHLPGGITLAKRPIPGQLLPNDALHPVG
jgi:hypothetical protein